MDRVTIRDGGPCVPRQRREKKEKNAADTDNQLASLGNAL